MHRGQVPTVRTTRSRMLALVVVVVTTAMFATAPAVSAAGSRPASGAIGAAVVPTITDLAVLGDAVSPGSTASVNGNQPVVGLARTTSGNGAWFVANDGGVFAFGDAGFFGSTGSIALNRPVVGIAATPTGNGYWLVASDGGIFAFGDAAFFGSTGSIALNRPVVGMAATPTGNGYWLVASDGGIFAFGDAAFFGSTGSLVLNRPVVGMAATPTGNGYLLVASDGGIFAFGGAVFRGSTGALPPASPIVAIATRPAGDGYWLVEAGGGVTPFGLAPAIGDARDAPVTMPIVAAVSTPSGLGLFLAGTGSTVVHFVRDGKLAATRRDARPTPVMSTTVTDLLAGPNPFEGFLGFSSAIPTGTTLLGLDVVGDLATVDLSGRFLEGGGTLSLQQRTAQVVFTLTAFPGITRVAFRIDGNLVVTIGPDGIRVDPPVGRSDFDALRPDILVTFPAAGQVVAAPMLIVGEANTFEGNVVMTLTDASGRALGRAQATGAMGFWLGFGASLDYSPGAAATGAADIFWISPKDGARVAVVDFPVRFRP